MSRAIPPGEGPAAGDGGPGEDGAATSKVVLMELVEAGRPLSAAELTERTLLASETVESALAALRTMDLCREVPGDERRPTRYAAEAPPTGDDA